MPTEQKYHSSQTCSPVSHSHLRRGTPFQQITLDLITRLPPNGPHDSVLTIVDHGCSRAAVFLPCATTITGPGVAQLYFDNVYWWFGLPSKIISDRDPHFTSHFGRALADKIGAKQTSRPHSTPKLMDSQSAKTNGSNNTYASLQTLNKKTGVSGSQWRPQYIMITSMPPWGWPQVKSYWDINPPFTLIKTFHQTIRWQNNTWKHCIRSAPKPLRRSTGGKSETHPCGEVQGRRPSVVRSDQPETALPHA